MTANLAAPGSNTGEAAGDTYSSMEALAGSAFNDTLRGDGNSNWLYGREGADLLDGGAAGFDYAAYNTAKGAVRASLTDSSVNTGEAAGDSYLSIEALAGSAFNDELIGDVTGNWLRGNADADILNGQGGEDTASYWASSVGVKASLATPGIKTGEAKGDTYISIERLGGSQFADTLIGDGGNNWLVGEGGADKLVGGDGTDTAAYHNSSSGLTASLANAASNTGQAAGDTYSSIENLYGTNYGDTLIGTTAANWLGGNSGDDTLIGGKGADTLDGAGGADYASYVDSAGAVRASLAAPATNTGEAAGDIYISIERLAGSQFNDKLTGDAFDNTLRGNGGADMLNGGAGFDYASYFSAATGVMVSLATPGSNTGDAAGDTYKAIEGLSGSTFADHLIGDDSNNWLIGQGGADQLDGGLGSDYAAYVNATSGVTASLATPGANTGEATGDSYTSIENLAGSAFNDTLRGTYSDNVLRGQGGADVLDGQGGLDVASYFQSSIGLTVSLATPSTNTGEAAGDTYLSIEGLAGTTLNDILIGDSGNNTLTGQGGADKLIGGAGFDTAMYKVATAGVTASLASPASNTGEAQGDTYSSIEGLTGSDFGDTLIGNTSANALNGGAGNDTLTGGAGADRFLFSTALNALMNVDTITDFNVADDTVHLDHAIFSSLPIGGLLAAAFRVGSAAGDASDRIIYNSATGALLYDSNGNASGGSTQFATLGAGLALTKADFQIV